LPPVRKKLKNYCNMCMTEMIKAGTSIDFL